MKKNYTRGFTLIELLVVIAIIGILASIVLVSLNSARNKGNDTRIIADVQQMRTILETNYNGNTWPDLSTNGTSTTGPGAVNTATLSIDAAQQLGVSPAINIVTTGTSPNFIAYAIFGKLKSPSTATYFCIDSTGKTNPTASANTAGTCP